MTEEKICPVMSRPAKILNDIEQGIMDDDYEITIKSAKGIYKNMYVPCLKEKCMAWVPEVECCGTDLCEEDDTDACNRDTCKKFTLRIHEEGYCKLIERGGV